MQKLFRTKFALLVVSKESGNIMAYIIPMEYIP